MRNAKKKIAAKRTVKRLQYPIQHWSHSSLLAYLRNPLAWYKRYVLHIYDTPRSPAAVIGSAGHVALEHFYQGASKEHATEAGLLYVRSVPDFELNFGKAKSIKAKKVKRLSMERDYLQAISFYLKRAPRHKVVGVEVKGVSQVPGLPLTVKAISDLVVESSIEPGALDIVDHKFVDTFSKAGVGKALFELQAIFNYYTVQALYGKPVRQFIVYECKKTKNANGSSQLRRYAIDFTESADAFATFHRLLKDATKDIASRQTYLPNPSDMFEGEDSFAYYKLGLIE